jgi:hypothetical protein
VLSWSYFGIASLLTTPDGSISNAGITQIELKFSGNFHIWSSLSGIGNLFCELNASLLSVS